ncbi:related to integral membrane protein PTH11 [Phialocephala subalpina]|uniref:Related to integral membrane protein PTH11 n=1 Tax=Phialocephala subalpina TaxID=576137 RepID=A0A1L7X8N3_9HELO|nr:related to integral membrane protein PTH11 [Phialocephala subalpina]
MATSSAASTTSFLPIPTGTVSAHIGKPENTTDDYYIGKYLLMVFGKTTDPALGAFLPPARPAQYVYETRGPRIIASMSVAIAVMVIVTSLRLGVRVFRRGLLAGRDDVFTIPSVLLAVAWPTLQICAVIYGGAGKHMYDITYEEYGHFKTFSNLSEPMFFLAVGFIKVSICLFNRRLTSLTSRAWTLFSNIFLVLLFCYIMLSLFWTIFQCNPPYAGWDPIRIGKEGKVPKCIGDNMVGSTLSVIHVIMDFGLLSIPLIVLWQVRMGWGTRARLYFVFSIGAMSCVGSIMRQIEQKRLTFNDILWNFVALENWTLIHLCFGVVAASLPILSAFIPKSWKSVRGTTDPTSYNPSARSGPLNGRSEPYIRSTRRCSISGKRETSDSTENIVRTDVIELSYRNKSQFFDKESAVGDGNSEVYRREMDRKRPGTSEILGSDGHDENGRKIWIGLAQ